eukprot:1297781-Pyramimonas_sp.AAC.1
MTYEKLLKYHSAKRWSDWKAWAQDAASAKACKAAHAYSKVKAPVQRPRAAEGWALQGDNAIAALQEEWGKHWLSHDCPLSPAQHAEADAEPPLVRPDREQVMWALSNKFKHETGLGVD